MARTHSANASHPMYFSRAPCKRGHGMRAASCSAVRRATSPTRLSSGLGRHVRLVFTCVIVREPFTGSSRQFHRITQRHFRCKSDSQQALGQKEVALLRGLGTSHNVPISPVTAEEKVARSSSHLIYFPADVSSSLQRNTGRRNRRQGVFTSDCLSSPVTAEEKVARSSSHLIYFPADVFSSLQRNTGRRNRRQRFFTSDCLSSRVTAKEKVARSSSHLIYFPAYVFSSLQKTPGSENAARGSTHLIRIAHGRVNRCCRDLSRHMLGESLAELAVQL